MTADPRGIRPDGRGAIGLGTLELALANDGRFDQVDLSHLHRASFETDLDVVEGRELVRERRMADAAAAEGRPTRLLHDLGDMIVFAVGGGEAGEDGWRGHRWARREGGWIAAESLILDGAARALAGGFDLAAAATALGVERPVHGALGELHPGRGQFAESAAPRLPVDWPDAAGAAALYLHQIWNRRALGRIEVEHWHGPEQARGDGAEQRRWLARLLVTIPDAVLLFERAIVDGDRVAVAWRLHGHHLGPGLGLPPTGRRLRALGSSVLTMAGDQVVAEDMLIDTLALRAQLHRPEIGFAPSAEAVAPLRTAVVSADP